MTKDELWNNTTKDGIWDLMAGFTHKASLTRREGAHLVINRHLKIHTSFVVEIRSTIFEMVAALTKLYQILYHVIPYLLQRRRSFVVYLRG